MTEPLHDHGKNSDKLLTSMPTEANFIKAADTFQQLCDRTRLKILWLLCHSEECVYNIAAAVGMSGSAVSHHLRTLKQTGLIQYQRIGKEVHYTLANTAEARLVQQIIDDIFEMHCLK